MIPSGAIVILAHSRADLLRECIDSILAAEKSVDWKKLLVLQRGFVEVEQVVDEYLNSLDMVIYVNSNQASTLGNINHNRLLGMNVAFDSFRADFVLGVEEDTVIANDSLEFCKWAVHQYQGVKSFKGVNLGSIETPSNLHSGTYSLLRFGLQGQAGLITKRTWSRIDFSKLYSEIDSIPWDYFVEFELKRGFMVTPNYSKSLDRGWQGGSFADNNQFDPHYIKMGESWELGQAKQSRNFERLDIRHSWKLDSILFRKRESILFEIRQIQFIKDSYYFFRRLGLKRLVVNVNKDDN